MLILSRRAGERIVIGHDVVVTVLEVNRGQVRIGIVAPPKVRVDRQEVRQRLALEAELRDLLSRA